VVSSEARRGYRRRRLVPCWHRKQKELARPRDSAVNTTAANTLGNGEVEILVC